MIYKYPINIILLLIAFSNTVLSRTTDRAFFNSTNTQFASDSSTTDVALNTLSLLDRIIEIRELKILAQKYGYEIAVFGETAASIAYNAQKKEYQNPAQTFSIRNLTDIPNQRLNIFVDVPGSKHISPNDDNPFFNHLYLYLNSKEIHSGAIDVTTGNKLYVLKDHPNTVHVADLKTDIDSWSRTILDLAGESSDLNRIKSMLRDKNQLGTGNELIEGVRAKSIQVILPWKIPFYSETTIKNISTMLSTLDHASMYELKLTDETIKKFQRIAEDFDADTIAEVSDQDEVKYFIQWLEVRIPSMFLLSPNLKNTIALLEQFGLKEKLLAIGLKNNLFNLTRWLSYAPEISDSGFHILNKASPFQDVLDGKVSLQDYFTKDIKVEYENIYRAADDKRVAMLKMAEDFRHNMRNPGNQIPLSKDYKKFDFPFSASALLEKSYLNGEIIVSDAEAVNLYFNLTAFYKYEPRDINYSKSIGSFQIVENIFNSYFWVFSSANVWSNILIHVLESIADGKISSEEFNALPGKHHYFRHEFWKLPQVSTVWKKVIKKYPYLIGNEGALERRGEFTFARTFYNNHLLYGDREAQLAHLAKADPLQASREEIINHWIAIHNFSSGFNSSAGSVFNQEFERAIATWLNPPPLVQNISGMPSTLELFKDVFKERQDSEAYLFSAYDYLFSRYLKEFSTAKKESNSPGFEVFFISSVSCLYRFLLQAKMFTSRGHGEYEHKLDLKYFNQLVIEAISRFLFYREKGVNVDLANKFELILPKLNQDNAVEVVAGLQCTKSLLNKKEL